MGFVGVAPSPFPPYQDVRREFHGVGNGVNDDTLAINNAIAAANAYGAVIGHIGSSGGTVFLPAGFWVVTAPLSTLTKTRIIGEGAATVILYSLLAGQTLFTISGAGGVENVTLINNAGTDVQPIHLRATASAPSLFHVSGVLMRAAVRGVMLDSASGTTNPLTVIREVAFDGASALTSGASGFIYLNRSSGNGGYTAVERCSFAGDAGTGSHVAIAADHENFSVMGNDMSLAVGAAGVTVGAGASDYYTVVNNDYNPALTAGVVDGGSGTHKAVDAGIGFGSSGGGGGGGAVQYENSNYSMLATDAVVVADASAADVTISWPNVATAVVGKPYTIRAAAVGTPGAVLTAAAGGHGVTYNGGSTFPALTAAGTSITAVFDGASGWVQI